MKAANRQHGRRNEVLNLYWTGVEAVRGSDCVARYLGEHPIAERLYLVAIGKAACAMTRGALDVCGPAMQAGLIITKHDYLDADLARNDRLQCMQAGHPLPDQGSLDAGAALLEFVQRCPQDGHLLCLISGGASALVEVLPQGVTLEQLRRVNEWLLASGLAIDRMNSIRQRLSCIKGGRLAQHVHTRGVTALLISDVRGDDPAVIGSGLLVAARRSTDTELGDLPDWLLRILPCAENPQPLNMPAGVTVRVIARLQDAMQAVAQAARASGHAVQVHEDLIDGDAVAAGASIGRQLRQGLPGVHVWGGETTVHLPARPGRGGRAQSLALAAAQEIQDCAHCVLLAAGTDGSDGPGLDAGGLVDAGTIARGHAAGLDAAACLAQADAGSFLGASGDLLQTGVTGTNVTDLIVALK